jgi:anti-anti-sigma factor
VKRTEILPENARDCAAPRFWTGGKEAFPAARLFANYRPDVRVWAVGKLTLVEFLNVHALLEEEPARELADRLERLVALGHVQIVLDMSAVRYASDAVVCLLARLYRQVNEAGGSVRFYRLGPSLLESIRICRLDRVVEICVDEAAALRTADSNTN